MRLYASYAGKPDRLFRADAQTGWSNAPGVQTTWLNAAGKAWSIRTDADGQRLMAQDAAAGRRILILGDSLPFGEGIDIEDRFDCQVCARRGADVRPKFRR